jgi:hypothetical protein
MTALAVWMAAIWIGWKIEEAAERIAAALGEPEDE